MEDSCSIEHRDEISVRALTTLLLGMSMPSRDKWHQFSAYASNFSTAVPFPYMKLRVVG